MAMSSQWWKLARMAECVSGSAARKFPIVWSEKTTPQPKVSSGRFRSYTSTRTDGSAFRSRMAAYSPAGPPPRHTSRLILALPLGATISPACCVCYIAKYFKCQLLFRLYFERTHEHSCPNPGSIGCRHRDRRHPRNRPHHSPGAGHAHHQSAAAVRELEAVRAAGDFALRRAWSGLVLE